MLRDQMNGKAQNKAQALAICCQLHMTDWFSFSALVISVSLIHDLSVLNLYVT